MRGYADSNPLPNVYGIPTAGGASYNDRRTDPFVVEASFPFYPTSWIGRCQTPVSRIAAVFGISLEAWDPRNGPRR